MSLNVKISGTEVCPKCGHVFTVGGNDAPPKKKKRKFKFKPGYGTFVLLCLLGCAIAILIKHNIINIQ